MLRFLTSGESHGRCLVAILEGMVRDVPLDERQINRDLARRQAGYGRGGRMALEKDSACLLSGVRRGRTTGSPIAIRIPNRDFKIDVLPVVTRPRPGHADLAGALKYDRHDVRDVLERASARETTARVAVGSVCKQFLGHFGVKVLSHVVGLGGVFIQTRPRSFEKILREAEKSPVRCCDPDVSQRMMERIDSAKKDKDTLGGLFEVCLEGIPSSIAEDKAFEAQLVFNLVSIQAVKGVEVTATPDRAAGRGLVVLSAAMKPISTLMRPLRSVDIVSKRPAAATVERSDVTAVPACGVVAEAMAAFGVAGYYLERFGTGTLAQLKKRAASFRFK